MDNKPLPSPTRRCRAAFAVHDGGDGATRRREQKRHKSATREFDPIFLVKASRFFTHRRLGERLSANAHERATHYGKLDAERVQTRYESEVWRVARPSGGEASFWTPHGYSTITIPAPCVSRRGNARRNQGQRRAEIGDSDAVRGPHGHSGAPFDKKRWRRDRTISPLRPSPFQPAIACRDGSLERCDHWQKKVAKCSYIPLAARFDRIGLQKVRYSRWRVTASASPAFDIER